MSELTKEQLYAVMKLIRSYPEFFEALFSREFMLNTRYDQDEFKNRNAQLSSFDFSKLWDMVKEERITKMLNELKNIIRKVKNDTNAYNRWRNIIELSIVRGRDGVRYRSEGRDALLEFLKSPTSNDVEFSKNLGKFLSENRPVLLKFAQFYTKKMTEQKAAAISDSKQEKTSSSAKSAIHGKREWLGEYRALSEEITDTLENFSKTKDVENKTLINLIIASIKAKGDYFTLQQRSPMLDQNFARLFDGGIKHLVAAIRSKYNTDLEMYSACIAHLASLNILDRDLFADYFSKSPEFVKTDDGKFQLTMPTSFKGGCDINFKVNAGRFVITKDIKNFVGAQEYLPGPGLAINKKGGYSTTAESLLAATATIIPIGAVPFSVPNKSGKDTTAFAPTREFFNDGKPAAMQEVDISAVGNTATKTEETKMTFVVALGKANAKVTLKKIGDFTKVPERKPITKAHNQSQSRSQ